MLVSKEAVKTVWMRHEQLAKLLRLAGCGCSCALTVSMEWLQFNASAVVTFWSHLVQKCIVHHSKTERALTTAPMSAACG